MITFQTPIQQMPRKNAGYRLDERCIDALRELAKRTGKSVNEYLEELLFQHAKINGVLPPDAEPLGETRGGKREGAGKPKRSSKKSEQESEDQSPDPTSDNDGDD